VNRTDAEGNGHHRIWRTVQEFPWRD